ncbi:MTOR-associated protein MEAK7 isoform X1 [Poecilia latipinna]|uniref:MTOR-associated protein MEAK7 n=2 Tax=Poecilia TaxID=8080 RepID=A0A087Y2I6_POEFO|nr:PREDICTED: TLD domain-containing protein 1 isoform X1 [Poecilia formosa]XP_014873221.1 PREDICTED: TLD domain-containing protein 1 isoform X1 [Poecilia latipinna]
MKCCLVAVLQSIMGNSDSVMVQKRMARFRPEERSVIDGVFKRLQTGGPGKTLQLEALQASLGALVPVTMVTRMFWGLCSIEPGLAEPGRASAALGPDREQLMVFLADVLRGTAEERAPLVMAMSHNAAGWPQAVSCQQVAAFLEDLITAVVHILTRRGRLQGWRPQQMGNTAMGVKLLAEQMTSDLRPSDPTTCDLSCLEDWVFRVPQVAQYLEVLVAEGLDVSLSGWTAPALLPQCRDTDWTRLTVLLDVPTLMFLAPQLPDGCSAPWRLVFSTQLHGESFTRMAAALQHHGPTMLLLRDSRGHVFGGFASTAWEHKPQFQGDSRCFLFSVFPTLRVYTATGYNEHFMYLNQHQQTMPNGLGMGGQHDYFGLWLDSDFGRGHSRARPKCTTYGNPQLSADEDFVLDAVEVWAVGKPPAPAEDEEEEEGKKSILTVNPEVQAMMELTGKTLHSEGFSELQEDFD